MRVSRPCYDKYHRCPGWAGGGLRYAKADRCENGSLTPIYDKRLWKWRVNRCPKCHVVVLPYMVRWLDWRWWRLEVRHWAGNLTYWHQERKKT